MQLVSQLKNTFKGKRCEPEGSVSPAPQFYATSLPVPSAYTSLWGQTGKQNSYATSEKTAHNKWVYTDA